MDLPALERIRKFSFPLNVYAYLLAEASGRGDVFHLHFGWFDDPDEPMADAQARASRELLAWLPEPPARVLEVGSGVGTTLAGLVAQGYAAQGITPDGAQVAFMRERHGGAFPVMQVRFEDLAPPAEKFDAVLCQESGQYIAQDILLDQVAAQMRPGGRWVLADEFQWGEPQEGEWLHSLPRLKQAAAARGFVLRDERHQTHRAAPTVDRMLEATARHREAMRRALGVSDAQIDALDESNRNYRRKYASGQYGYAQLCFGFDGG